MNIVENSENVCSFVDPQDQCNGLPLGIFLVVHYQPVLVNPNKQCIWNASDYSLYIAVMGTI